jgi:hypothetical protein
MGVTQANVEKASEMARQLACASLERQHRESPYEKRKKGSDSSVLP